MINNTTKVKEAKNTTGEIETLQELGLTANEAKLYLLLARLGSMKATELAIKSGLQRRTVYDTAQQLEKKGLAGKAEVSGVTMFSASPPSSLLTFMDEKRDLAEKLLPAMARAFEQEEKTQVSVLYGANGIKMVLKDILELRPKLYYSYNGQMQFYDYIPKSIQMFHDSCAKRGIQAKYLLIDVPQARERAKLMPESDVKFIDPSSVSAGVWWAYENRVVLFVLQKEKEPVTIFVKNAELAATFIGSFKRLFESRMRIHQGKEAIKALLRESLKEEELLLIGGRGKVPHYLPEYFKNEFTQLAEKKRYKWRLLALPEALNTEVATASFVEMRLMPEIAIGPMVIWLLGNKVLNVVWSENPVIFEIEDEKVSKSYRSYFEMLWERAEPVKKDKREKREKAPLLAEENKEEKEEKKTKRKDEADNPLHIPLEG